MRDRDQFEMGITLVAMLLAIIAIAGSIYWGLPCHE